MKAFFLSLPVIGMAVGAYAQGFIFLDNINSTNTSPTATSGGLFFTFTNGLQLISGDFNAAFYGGTDSHNLQLIASFLVLLLSMQEILVPERFWIRLVEAILCPAPQPQVLQPSL